MYNVLRILIFLGGLELSVCVFLTILTTIMHVRCLVFCFDLALLSTFMQMLVTNKSELVTEVMKRTFL